MTEQSTIPHLEDTDADFETKRGAGRFIGWMRQSRFRAFRQKVALLNLSQWFYLAAVILLLITLGQDVDDESGLIWVGIIAGIGLARELWHVFNRVWENIFGKSLIFVLYAATANIAIAVAALKINEISGIEPTPFVFTIGFTTLLMLPFWLMLSSIIFFSLMLLATNLWLVISILLRLVRIKVKVHWEDKSFVFLTMLLRIVLIVVVLNTIERSVSVFADQIRIFDNISVSGRGISFDPSVSVERRTEGQAPASDEPTPSDANANLENESSLTDSQDIVQDDAIDTANAPDNTSTKPTIFERIIANFIFYFETYPYSKCEKAPHQRSLPIDENLILLVEENDSLYGYKFTVKECEGKKTPQIIGALNAT